MKDAPKTPLRPPQHQSRQPGAEGPMRPPPRQPGKEYRAAGKLAERVALISGGDSGIGRGVALAFAREGADLGITYFDEHDDARETSRLVEQIGRRCVVLAGDVGDPEFCRHAVGSTVKELGHLDVLVNNAAEQHPVTGLAELTDQQLERTFRTNVFACFYLARAAIEHLPRGGAIINTTSVTAYRGSHHLIDYAATKGALVAFTRSLALALVEEGIRVNGVAPGPVWTPLIPASFSADEVATFGSDVPMRRAGEPAEIAPSFVFLASDDSSYMTGQILHPNGGEIVNA